MAIRKRNPVLGCILAVLFLGWGVWRLYGHFVLTPLETPYVVLGFGFIAYGLYILYDLIIQKNA